MKTYDLVEAAEILKMTPEGLRRKVVLGIVKGVKPGRRWCFRECDLADFMDSLYSSTANKLQGVNDIPRRKSWRFTKEMKFGGLKSATLEKRYNELLAPRTKR